ncbi:hypothetical protein P3S67_014177 [Capsicum chacoense]
MLCCIYCICEAEEASSDQDKIFIFALKHSKRNLVQTKIRFAIMKALPLCSAFFRFFQEIQAHFLNQEAKTLKRVASSLTDYASLIPCKGVRYTRTEYSADGASPTTTTSDQSGDLSLDVKFNVVQKKDLMLFNFLALSDLSNRKAPAVLLPLAEILGKQRLREARIVGLCLGTLVEVSDETFGLMGTFTPALLSSHQDRGFEVIFSNKLHYWRESASGISSLAYFMPKDTVDHINTIVKPEVYLSMFYFFNNPRSSILDNYLVLLCVVYCVTGIAYALAIYFEPGQAQLWLVLLPVVLTLVASKDSAVTAIVGDYIYSKWALEEIILANAKRVLWGVADHEMWGTKEKRLRD